MHKTVVKPPQNLYNSNIGRTLSGFGLFFKKLKIVVCIYFCAYIH